MPDLSCRVSEHLSENAKALIWQVFFSSRERGLTFPLHFPWTNNPGSFHSVSLEMADQNEILATLLMKRFLLRDNQPAAMVGLVCVHPQARGKGLSKVLLKAAGETAHNLGLQALLLWTQKPGVYEPLGYKTIAHEQLWEVSVPLHLANPITAGLTSEQVIELASGLPPFALGARRYMSVNAQAVVLQTVSCNAVVAWEGKTDDVAQLLLSVLPERWMLNTLPEDDLPGVLTALGCVCNCSQNVHRMLGDCQVLPSGVNKVLNLIPPLRMLERI